MRYLIDTNIISFALRDQFSVNAAFGRHATADLLLSTIVLGEGRVGSYRTANPHRWLEGWDLFTKGWELVPFDAVCADMYGRIRADLERRGNMIGFHDCQIAATALAYAQVNDVAVTLVTDNLDEFKRVPGLKVANWAKRTA